MADGRGKLAGDLARSPDLHGDSGWFYVILIYYNDDSLTTVYNHLHKRFYQKYKMVS